MLGDLLEIGDAVDLHVEKDATVRPCYSEGTKATVIGFCETDYGWANQFGKPPGMYANTFYPNVRLEDGQELTVYCGNISLLNQEEFKRRDRAGRDERGRFISKDIWLRDLPETPFIEGDKVTCPILHTRDSFPNGIATIVGVKYSNIGDFCADGLTPLPIYDISDRWPSGWHTWVRGWDESRFELVERGWVWKFHNGVPIEFPSIEEQATFLHNIGETYEVRNPAYDLYKWTKDEAVDAIYSGLGHSIHLGNGLFGAGPHTSVRRFKDEAIGEVIRQVTMKGFPRVHQTA